MSMSFTVQSGDSPKPTPLPTTPPAKVSPPLPPHAADPPYYPHTLPPQQQFQQLPQQAQLQPPHGMLEYEAHDPVVKSSVSFSAADVVPTMATMSYGGNGGPGGSKIARVCEQFQQGTCRAGAHCNEFHVLHEVLTRTRRQMREWLAVKETDFNASTPQVRTFRVFCADLKEVIDVPVEALSFTRGLYLDPNVREKRSKNRHAPSSFAVIASQVPTACGLYASDPGMCKWGKWCNQAHVDPLWLRSRRGEFESWSASLETMFTSLSPDHVFRVHDPETRVVLQASRGDIAEYSRGLFQGTAHKSPSVCLLFQRGRCTARTRCNQVHVHPQWLARQRQQLAQGAASEPPAYPAAFGATPPPLALMTTPPTQHLGVPPPYAQTTSPPAVMAIPIEHALSPAPVATSTMGDATTLLKHALGVETLNPQARPFVPGASKSPEKTPQTKLQSVLDPWAKASSQRPPRPARVPRMFSTGSAEWDFANDEEFQPVRGGMAEAYEAARLPVAIIGREAKSPVRELPSSEVNVFAQFLSSLQFTSPTKPASPRKKSTPSPVNPDTENSTAPKAASPVHFSGFFSNSDSTPSSTPSLPHSQLLFRAAPEEEMDTARDPAKPRGAGTGITLEGFDEALGHIGK